jgi:hypothetical protein
MGGMSTLLNKWLGPTVLCCTCLALPAVAASPLQKVINRTAPQPTAVASPRSAPLDLRPPPLTGATGAAEFGRLNDTGDDKRFASLGAAMNQERQAIELKPLSNVFTARACPSPVSGKAMPRW